MPDPNDLKNLSSQLKKTIIFAESFKGGSSVDPSKNILNIQKTTIGLAGHVLQLVSIVSDLAKIVNNNSKKITSLKNISKSQSSRISGKNIGAKLPGSSTSNVEDNISKITKSVISIAEILSGQKKLKDSSTSYDRRKAEQEKRSLAESKLEKRFDGLKKAAEKILAPVKSLLDKIINFLVTVFLGRVVYKLLEWFGDPKNADKVKSIGRFLGDHWPKLLALYLTFGTSFGRFALGLTKAVASGAIKLAFAIAKLLAAKKVKGAMGAARFLGGKGGKIAGAVLGTAAAVTGAYALTQGMKGDDEEPKTLKPEEPKIPGYAGGGIIKIPAFKGGGFNFKGMFGGALGSSPEKPQEMPNGFVSGEKGVDKVPAMLSDGEFVMSVGAVQKYGVDTLEGMNAAGGGTNKPKMMGGKTYAVGGGPIGTIGDGRDKDKGNPFSSLMTSASNMFTGNKPKPEKYGPPVQKFNPKKYTDSLVNASSGMQKEGWSFRGDPKNGCAPAINEVYKRANLTLPWAGIENINYVPKIYDNLNKTFVKVSENDRKPGDIVIWNDPRKEYTDKGMKDPEPYGHIGIVMKDGRIANNSSGRGTFTNLMTPEESKSSWENTKQLIYFRSPDVVKSLEKPKPKPESKPSGIFDNVAKGTLQVVSQMTGALSAMNPASLLANALGGSPAQAKPQTKAKPQPQPQTKAKPMSDGGIISKPPSAILNEDNMGGGFLNQLGRFLPNTGTVMAPRTSGSADVKGNRQTEPAYQNKLLGIPLGSPSSKFSEGGFRGMRSPLGPGGDVGGYTKEQKKRYSSRTGSSFVPTSYAGSISGAMGDSHLRFPGLPSLQNKKIEIPDYMMPSTPVSKPQQKPKGIVKDATDISTVMSNISREKIRQANKISPGSATEITYGQSQRMLAEQLGTSNRAEQVKQLKQQGLLPSFSSTNSSGSGSKQKTLGLTR